jgi:hypothetical protein
MMNVRLASLKIQQIGYEIHLNGPFFCASVKILI